MSDTAKSVLDIDVNDSAFKKFLELFNRYQEELKNTSRLWEEAGGATSDAAEEAEKLLDPVEAIAASAAVAAQGHEKIASMLAMQSSIMANIGEEQNKQLDQLTRLLKNQGRSEESSKRQTTIWHGLVNSTRGVAYWIADATSNLLKWGTITGAVGGLLGLGGGLYGIDRLGGVAGAWRRQAMGLGLGGNIGEPQAFNAFSRLVDPQSVLGGVQSAIQDPTKRLPFSLLGIGQPGYNANPAAVAAEVLQRLPGYVRGQQAAGIPLETIFQAGQFQNLGLSFQDFVRLGQTSSKEMEELVGKYRAQAAKLDALVTPDIAKRWQDFTLQLQFAGQTLQAVLIRGLVRLTGPLSDLSNSMVNFLQKLTNTKNLDDFIGELGKGIEWISKWIDSITQEDINKFENTIKQVGQDILDFGKTVLQIIEWFNAKAKWFQNLDTPGKPAPAPHAGVDPQGQWFGPNQTLWRNPNGDIVDPNSGQKIGPADSGSGWGGLGGWLSGLFKPSSYTTPPEGWTGGFSNAALRMVEASNNLPAGTLTAVEWAESRGNPRAQSPAGAQGLFQIMPSTARDLGINPWDPRQALEGAGSYLGQLMKQFGGDLAKALAAYNEGPGALQQQIGAWGKDWVQHLPAETEQYVGNIMRSMALAWRAMGIPGSAPRYSPPTVHVVISNNSGSNVHVSTQQLGVGVSI